MWNFNGALIQDYKAKTNYVKSFNYLGVNAFHSFPLIGRTENDAQLLTREQMFGGNECNRFIPLEFISNKDLYERYVNKCNELNISFRTVFVESDYSDEVWNGLDMKKKVLGYEYCPMPIDEQIITDLDWYPKFECFRKKLNEYGLFKTYEEAKEFRTAYDLAFQKGLIGDGAFEGYIFCVSEVID